MTVEQVLEQARSLTVLERRKLINLLLEDLQEINPQDYPDIVDEIAKQLGGRADLADCIKRLRTEWQMLAMDNF